MKTVFPIEGSLYHAEENRTYLSSPAGLEKARLSGAVIEGLVTMCDSSLRLHIDLGCAHGIMEAKEAVLCRPGEVRKDIAVISRVGKPIGGYILAIEEGGTRPIVRLSRRRLQEECLAHYLRTLVPGDILAAKVTHLEPFGAFLDIGSGISSLLSVDRISVSRISHPRDRLRVGDTIRVAVGSIDREGGKIYTTMRELLGTWEENAAGFEAGQTVRGILRSVESYGAFVELTPNLAGLCEIREGEGERLRARIGKSVAVYIKSIVPDRMKIKLVLIDGECGEATAGPLNYFIDPEVTPHLSHWLYSPDGARKVVETRFDEPV